MPSPRPNRAHLTAEQMLGDVRRVLAKWQEELLGQKDGATGADAQNLLTEVRAAAWPKHK